MGKPKLKKKRAKPRKHMYFGEQRAKTLLDWAYEPATNENHRKVVFRMIELGRAYQDSRNRDARERLRGNINTILAGLKFYPIIADVKGTWTVLWEGEEFRGAADAVRLWLELVSLGLLGRLRRCGYKKCGKWFFARFPHALFHTVACHDAAVKEDPVKAEQRKEYQQRYYRTSQTRPHQWK